MCQGDLCRNAAWRRRFAKDMRPCWPAAARGRKGRAAPSFSPGCNAVTLPNDAWPVLAGAAAACLLLAAWLVGLGGRARDGRARGADRRPGRIARTLAALRRPALAAFGAFMVSAALDGIAALLPPEVPAQAQPRDCAPPPAGRATAACETAPETRPGT